MSDGFGAIRARVDRQRGAARGAPLLAPARVAARRRPRRRALVARAVRPRPPTDLRRDRDELAEAVAELLLHRWGVVFRDLAVHDSLRFPWRDLQWALRRLEDRGLVRGGRFVSRLQRRAVRAARRRSSSSTQVRKQPTHRRAGDGQRHRPAQPRRRDRAR